MKLKIIMLICFSILVTGCSQEAEIEIIEEMGIFSEYDACFILYDENNDKYHIFNESQANEPLSPCSTFKIVNSLIGLETGVAKDVNHLYKWDGKQRSVSAWNQDHTMETAIFHSAIWYYQALAEDIGEVRMKEYLERIDYGNKDTSGGLTEFWLRSSLKISALDQVELLKKLYHDELPFTKENMAMVRKIIVLEETDDYVLSGKTGGGEGKIGWFIGHLSTDEGDYYFATNLLDDEDAAGYIAKEMTIEILKERELIK